MVKFTRETVPQERWVTRLGVTFREINAQALYCGYIQNVVNDSCCDRSLELFHVSGCFHVRYVDWNITDDITSDGVGGYIKTHSFASLEAARKQFHRWLPNMVS